MWTMCSGRQRNAGRPAAGASAVQETRVDCDGDAARWRGRTARRVRDSGRSAGGVGALARGQRNRVGGKEGVGAGRLELVFSRSGPASVGGGDAGGVDDLLRAGGLIAKQSRSSG